MLIWGAEASVNFLSGRRSPTRYAYLHPLMTTGYGDAARVRDFLSALRDHPPAMIVDTSPTEPLFPPIDDASRRRWRPWPEYVPPAQFAEVIAWVNEHYTLDAVLRASGWKIYVPRGDGGKR